MRYLVRSFSYNGREKPDWLHINKVHRPFYAPIEPITMSVPGRPGSYFFGNRTGSREISIDIEIHADNDNDLWLKIEWLIEWLNQGKELPLSFNDEPDRYFKAVFVGGSDAIEQLPGGIGQGSLNFLCPDPAKYGMRYNYDLTADPVFSNDGTADMFPKILVNFTQDNNYFSVVGAGGSLQLGNPAGVGDTTIKPLERVLLDQMNDLTPWTSSGVVIDYGGTAGSFRVDDGHKFVVNSWDDDSSNASQWHGPVLKRALPAPVKDFRAVFDIDMNNPPNTAGRVELWLLNAAGSIMGRLVFYDKYTSAQQAQVQITAGPEDNMEVILAHSGFPNSDSLTWNGSFQGRLILNRQGDTWRASIAKLGADGRLSTKSYAYASIKHGAHLDDIAQVQIGIRKFGNSPAFYAAIREVMIERINTPPASSGSSDAAETIFQAGDQLEIDFEQGAVFLNGEYANQYLTPGSSFFPFPPGVQSLDTRASNSGYTVTIDYEERFK